MGRDTLHTVDGGRLWITGKGRLLELGRALRLRSRCWLRHLVGRRGLLELVLRRRQAGTAGATWIGHDAAEQISRTMSDGRRRRLRRPRMLWRATEVGRKGGASASFELSMEASDLFVVPDVGHEHVGCTGRALSLTGPHRGWHGKKIRTFV